MSWNDRIRSTKRESQKLKRKESILMTRRTYPDRVEARHDAEEEHKEAEDDLIKRKGWNVKLLTHPTVRDGGERGRRRTEWATSQNTASSATVRRIVNQGTQDRRAHQRVMRKKAARTMQATLDCGSESKYQPPSVGESQK